eukprot:10231875-Lingulodinium_polyedra.AAC.1
MTHHERHPGRTLKSGCDRAEIAAVAQKCDVDVHAPLEEMATLTCIEFLRVECNPSWAVFSTR